MVRRWYIFGTSVCLVMLFLVRLLMEMTAFSFLHPDEDGAKTPITNGDPYQERHIEAIRRKYLDYLKEDERARVTRVESRGGDGEWIDIQYTIHVRAADVGEVRKWEEKRRSLLGMLRKESWEHANKLLEQEQANFQYWDSSEKMVVCVVPPEEDAPIFCREYFILDLESGRDGGYGAAAVFEPGKVYRLLSFTEHQVDISQPWKYDHLLKLNDEIPRPVERPNWGWNLVDLMQGRYYLELRNYR